MIRNYLRTSFRHLVRNRVQTTINVLGLSIGFAIALLITLFVKDEFTYDAFHSKSDRIHRAWVHEDWGENEQFTNSVTPIILGPTILENFPEIETYSRFVTINDQIEVNGDRFSEQISIGSEDFFNVFDFRLIEGSLTNTFQDPSSAVLTRSQSEKLFGTVQTIGNTLSLRIGSEFRPFTVKAVIEDIPGNSSLQFGILIPDHNLQYQYSERARNSWFNVQVETYFLLREGTDHLSLEAKFPPLMETLLGEDADDVDYFIGLQPLRNIHLDTEIPAGFAVVSNPEYSYILVAIAVLVLTIASINFITLSLGAATRRTREVGVRKSIGAGRIQLVHQFLTESILLSVTALVVGLTLAIINLELFNDLAGKNLSFQPDIVLISIGVFLVVLIGVLAGSYPAFFMSSFKPTVIFRGVSRSGSGKQNLRKILVAVQFLLSIGLISSTLIMQKQLRHMQTLDLGFNKDHMMVLQLNVTNEGGLVNAINEGFVLGEQFRTELMKIPGVSGVSVATHTFGTGGWTNLGYTDDDGTYREFDFLLTEPGFLEMMEMEMVEGRSFSIDIPADQRRSVVVNKAFAEEYNWEQALGKRLPGQSFEDHEIIGVVSDFNYASLRDRVQPLLITTNIEPILPGIENFTVGTSIIPKVIVRFDPRNLDTFREEIEAVWGTLTNGEEFTYSFVDETLAVQYEQDRNLQRISYVSSLLAILVGSMGLFALALLTMQGRLREISIRKVFGASTGSILVLVSRGYLGLILIALLISIPVVSWIMGSWLENFHYRTSIGWMEFGLAAAVTILVAAVTISYQSVKAAMTQPADTLKYE